MPSALNPLSKESLSTQPVFHRCEAAPCLIDMPPALDVILRNTIWVLLVVADPLGICGLSLMNLTEGRHAVLVHQRRVLVACVKITIPEHGLSRII